MVLRSSQLRPIPSFLTPFTQSTSPGGTKCRCLHQRVKVAPIPRPTPFVPDPQTFLTLIGRNLSQHAPKIPSWKALFSLTSAQLKELGVDPPRSRRYLLRWREKFRQGQFGAGGDLQHVENGVAQLKVAEVPVEGSTLSASKAILGPAHTRKIVVNVPAEGNDANRNAAELAPVNWLHVKGSHTIVGSHVQPLKGARSAKIEVKEGLWEDRRGHKIDGGERRQAEIRAKRRGEEKRAAR